MSEKKKRGKRFFDRKVEGEKAIAIMHGTGCITQKEIADKAGCSQSTISNDVKKGRELIAAEERAREETVKKIAVTMYKQGIEDGAKEVISLVNTKKEVRRRILKI